MRYSVVQAATLALFGLVNVFLGVNGAPTAITEVQDRAVETEYERLVARKEVEDITKHGYEVSAGPGLPKKPITYTITKPKAVAGQLDVIKVDKQEHTITVENAKNKEDKSKDRLGLADINIYLWEKKAEEKASDLAVVKFQGVTEDSTLPVIKEAYEKLHKNPTDTITLTHKSTGEEKTLFEELEKTAFGKSVAKLHAYGVGEIQEFVITGGPTHPDLAVHVK